MGLPTQRVVEATVLGTTEATWDLEGDDVDTYKIYMLIYIHIYIHIHVYTYIYMIIYVDRCMYRWTHMYMAYMASLCPPGGGQLCGAGLRGARGSRMAAGGDREADDVTL